MPSVVAARLCLTAQPVQVTGELSGLDANAERGMHIQSVGARSDSLIPHSVYGDNSNGCTSVRDRSSKAWADGAGRTALQPSGQERSFQPHGLG